MKLKDGVLSLKRSHRYYTQVQGQMAVTKTNWADFFVYSTHGHILERIKLDPNFWEMVSFNLTLLLTTPTTTTKTKTTPGHANSLRPLASKLKICLEALETT